MSYNAESTQLDTKCRNLIAAIFLVLSSIVLVIIWQARGDENKLIVAAHGKTENINLAEFKKSSLDKLHLSDLNEPGLRSLGLHNLDDPRLGTIPLSRLRDNYLEKLRLNSLDTTTLKKLELADLEHPDKFAASPPSLRGKPFVQSQVVADAQGKRPLPALKKRLHSSAGDRYNPAAAHVDNDKTHTLPAGDWTAALIGPVQHSIQSSSGDSPSRNRAISSAEKKTGRAPQQKRANTRNLIATDSPGSPIRTENHQGATQTGKATSRTRQVARAKQQKRAGKNRHQRHRAFYQRRRHHGHAKKHHRYRQYYYVRPRVMFQAPSPWPLSLLD